MAISYTCRTARKVIRKLDDANWNLVAYDANDKRGKQPLHTWHMQGFDNWEVPNAVIGADIVDSVEYSFLYFEHKDTVVTNMGGGRSISGNRKMHLCCVHAAEVPGRETTVVNDIKALDEETFEMVESILNS